ncbi:Protein Wnt-11b-2 [Eumeta japonica]|uniref:Protein Wnt n=1 Tax=Eumeta variegata TaxID=151549 RepID=A0A4C1X9T6_EUMVA|nr:Protein Wnt-11b-2 [Eumeta japonica]
MDRIDGAVVGMSNDWTDWNEIFCVYSNASLDDFKTQLDPVGGATVGIPLKAFPSRTTALYGSTGNWTEDDCSSARRGGALVPEQARACRRQPAAMPHVAEAARHARAACLAAHRGQRWNCSTVEVAPKYTPDLLTGETRKLYSFAGHILQLPTAAGDKSGTRWELCGVRGARGARPAPLGPTLFIASRAINS